MFDPAGFFPPTPAFDFPRMPSTVGRHNIQAETVDDAEDAFRVRVDVDGFKPEDLDVALKEDERLLVVTAKHEEKDKDGNKVGERNLKKSFVLPSNCILTDLKSSMTENGVLKIEAPKKKSSLPQVQQQRIHRPVLDRIRDDERRFEINIDVDGFKPNELDVKLEADRGVLSVSGRSASREFRKQYQMPANCELDKLNSALSKEGVLVIEAPKKRPELPSAKTIKIELK